MKRTTDWRWAHLSCSLWIPETFFRDGEGLFADFHESIQSFLAFLLGSFVIRPSPSRLFSSQRQAFQASTLINLLSFPGCEIEPLIYSLQRSHRSMQTCCYCGELEGACVECTEPSCNRFFHITCGFVICIVLACACIDFIFLALTTNAVVDWDTRMKHNVYLEYKESAGVGTDVVITLCHSHGRKWINRKDARCIIRSVK
jgi:hypothetical protein